MPAKHASVASPPLSRAVTLTCFRAALTSPTPSPFKEVRARVDAKGPEQRSGAGHGWRGRGPNNTDAVAGERADADRIPLLPVVHLVGADGSQTRSASMKIWELKAAPPTDPKGFNRSLGWEEGHCLGALLISPFWSKKSITSSDKFLLNDVFQKCGNWVNLRACSKLEC